MLERVVGVLCATGSRQDVIEVQSALKERAELYPSQQREIGWYGSASPDEVCPRFERRKTAASQSAAPFGD